MSGRRLVHSETFRAARPPKPQGDAATQPRWVRRSLDKGNELEDVLSGRKAPPNIQIKKGLREFPSRSRRPLRIDPTKTFPTPYGDLPKKLLEPHELSLRLNALCESGKLYDAITMLSNSPLDAQNTPVWNTMMWACMREGKYQRAYELYTDVSNFHSSILRTLTTMNSDEATWL